VSTLEATAFVLGIVTVVLVVRRSVWNFAFGIVSTALYAFVFVEARLYSDTLLQGFFIVVNAYGWTMWRRSEAAAGEVMVETMPARDRITWSLAWLVASVGWGAAMANLTDASLPWIDAGIAAASIAAQLMMAKRLIENWIVWIAVDIASVGLYAAKGLWLTVILYVIYLALSVWGLNDWRAAWRRDRSRAVSFA
jgi:nicotinamide mononucleotide transporter